MAFLSGQDIKMVQQEGNDTNCFVSLVVDTKGTYVAIVTRKLQSKSEVTIKSLGTSYEFFGEGSKTIAKDCSEIVKTVDKEVIEYFNLQVERHEVPNTLGYLDSRFDEIIAKKNAESSKGNSTSSQEFPQAGHSDGEFFSWLHSGNNSNNAKEPTLFNVPNDKTVPATTLPVDWTPNPQKVHEAAVHIVTLNLILNTKDFNFKYWITRHMNNVYNKVFGCSDIDCKSNLPTAFTEWKDFIIQFVLDYFDDSDIPNALMDDYDQFISIVAQSLIDELSEFSSNNPYIQEYINTLYQYML